MLWVSLGGLAQVCENFLSAWSWLAHCLGMLESVDTLVKQSDNLQAWRKSLADAAENMRVPGSSWTTGDEKTLQGLWCTEARKALRKTVGIHHLKALLRVCDLLVRDFEAEWRAANREEEILPSYECETKLIGLSVLCQLAEDLGGKCDAWRVLRGLGRLIPVVPLTGTSGWVLDCFLGDLEAGASFRKDYIQRFVASLEQRLPAYAKQVLILTSDVAAATEARREKYMVQAVALAYRIRRVLVQTRQLHALEQIPMSKALVNSSLSVCIELLETIQDMSCKFLSYGLTAANDSLSIHAEVFADIERQSSVWTRRRNKHRSPQANGLVMAGLDILEESTASMMSLDRIKLAIGAAAIAHKNLDGQYILYCSWEESIHLERQLERLRLISQWPSALERACDCTMLLWDMDTFLPVMLKDSPPARVPILVKAFARAGRTIFGASFQEERVRYRDKLLRLVKDHYLDPLCVRVDQSLRLEQHAIRMDYLKQSMLQVDQLKPALRTGHIQIMDMTIDSREYIEHYLQRQFYNMTVFSLHDWRVYAEMQKIAHEKYGLSIEDSALPQGGLDAGIDMLSILRRWSHFVSLYNYNLNQQFFIERRARRGAKSLRTLTVETISSSISTHGLGILSTCVNFTYQYLTEAFSEMSDLVMIEPIKSYLARERRWFTSHMRDSAIEHVYPYQRAFRYNREIRNIGELQPGVTYLTRIREIVTKIGNTLGFVRMVRAAGRHWVANAAQLLPNLYSTPLDLFLGNNEVDNAVISLAQVRETLCEKYELGKDYLPVLVEVFRDALRSGHRSNQQAAPSGCSGPNTSSLDHLDYFYMLVPALCVNFVESSLAAHERLARPQQHHDAFFTDDGFVVGVAYILTILDQVSKYSSLQWRRAIQDAFSEERVQNGGPAFNSYGQPLLSPPESNPSGFQNTTSKFENIDSHKLSLWQQHRLVELSLEASFIFFQ